MLFLCENLVSAYILIMNVQKVKEKLQERLAQHENILLAQHEAEMSRLMSGTNKMAAKVRQAMLMHKHMLEKEKFR